MLLWAWRWRSSSRNGSRMVLPFSNMEIRFCCNLRVFFRYIVLGTSLSGLKTVRYSMHVCNPSRLVIYRQQQYFDNQLARGTTVFTVGQRPLNERLLSPQLGSGCISQFSCLRTILKQVCHAKVLIYPVWSIIMFRL